MVKSLLASSLVAWFALVLVAIPLTACNSPGLCDGAGGTKGERSDKAAHLSAVMAVVGEDPDGKKGYLCSGVLVGPTTVLTAAHCVHDRVAWTFHAYAVDDLAFGRAESAPLPVTKWHMHPRFTPDGGGQFDIALLELAASAPQPPLPWTTAAPVDARYRFVGYGGPEGDATRCLQVRNEVTDVDASGGPIRAFVHPDIYYGDSGGPLLWDLASGPVVYGVLAKSTFIGSPVTNGSLVYFAKLTSEPWLRALVPSDPVGP